MNLPEIAADDFARRFALRASNLMWLLGAGASASALSPSEMGLTRSLGWSPTQLFRGGPEHEQ